MQLIENIKGSPVICQSGPQSPPRGRWMFLFLVYREGAASETLKRLTPKLEALRLEPAGNPPGFLSLRRMLSSPSKQFLGRPKFSTLQWQWPTVKKLHPRPQAKERSLVLLIGIWLKPLVFLSPVTIKPLKSPCSASAKSAILPALSPFIIYSLSGLG